MLLDRLLGTWTISMRHVAMPAPVSGQQGYRRVLGGAFVLLEWTYEHPEFPDALAMLDGTTCHYFDVRGITRTFDLNVSDAGWTMIRRDTDFWQRSAARFVGPDTMEGSGENSHDGGLTWQHDFSMSYARVG